MQTFQQWLLNEYGQWNTNNLIVCDIQPLYAKSFPFKVFDFATFLGQTVDKGKRVIFFYNGPDTVGEDSREDIINWLVEALQEGSPYTFDGEDEDYDAWQEEQWEKLDLLHQKFNRNILWYDKGYGFFRSWMDEGVDDAAIIRTIRYMAMKRIYDTRNLSEEELEQLAQGESLPNDMINLPSIPLNTLKQFNGSFLCGGGREECMKEIQLLMNAFNIKYTILRKFTF